MPIDAILFDKDGTLFDFANTWGAFGRNVVLRLADGDPARASELGRVIGFDLEKATYSEDSIVIAGTVDEIAEALVPHLPDMTQEDLVDVLNTESASAPQAPMPAPTARAKAIACCSSARDPRAARPTARRSLSGPTCPS